MYITINNLVGEKKVDLSYSILGFAREIAVISIFTKKLPNEIKEDLREELQLGKAKQKNKLLEMNFILNELDNTKNLEDGKLSNILFRHYVPSSEDTIHYEPRNPQYKKLKTGEIVSLNLRATDEKNDSITSFNSSLVLHVR